MEANNKKCNNQIEIHDLIDEAVNNALARRNHVIDANEGLSNLSSEEAGNIVGGASTPAIAGFKPICPPIIIGLIATDPDVLKA
uniref:Uncharacterized protein n=1 Tax=Desmonostoc muscorum PCC 7121 TaxID=197230 RepID=A0A2P0ZGU6_DESMC|nr:hypothetical protein [Desmonostoc muscorum PCC 7121]